MIACCRASILTSPLSPHSSNPPSTLRCAPRCGRSERCCCWPTGLGLAETAASQCSTVHCPSLILLLSSHRCALCVCVDLSLESMRHSDVADCPCVVVRIGRLAPALVFLFVFVCRSDSIRLIAIRLDFVDPLPFHSHTHQQPAHIINSLEYDWAFRFDERRADWDGGRPRRGRWRVRQRGREMRQSGRWAEQRLTAISSRRCLYLLCHCSSN